MADPTTYRPKQGEIPTSPGVYRFRDQHGRVIYVGKAKNLRARLANYFQPLHSLHPRTQQMVTTAASVEWTVVNTEVESLALEYSWIKEFEPRFNIKYRDDKTYPYLAVTMGEKVPRALVMRGAKKPGNRYFGPFAHAWAIRETLDLLLRVFPVRTCSAGVYRRAESSGRPCLLGYIDKCAAPCVGRISVPDHRLLAEDFCTFMAGQTRPFLKRLTAQMNAASAALDFETAARLRDDLQALEKAMEKNAVVLDDGTDADVFALAGDELEAAVQVFHVRGGRIRGQRGWVVEKVEDVTDAELVERLLEQVYGDDGGTVSGGDAGSGADTGLVPREVLVPVMPSDAEGLTAWLSGVRGSQVRIRVPERGAKKDLSLTVLKNAEHALNLHRVRRSGDLTTRSKALQEIQDALGLAEAPLRIECYDISHTQGTYQSASMVVFEDGLPRKSEYRTFSVRGDDGTGARDDTAAMYEVLTRRFRHHAEGSAPSSVEQPAGAVPPVEQPADAVPPVEQAGHGRVETTGPAGFDAARPSPAQPAQSAGPASPRRFAYPPQLVVVDGGPPQVAAAQRALEDAGVTDVALCGLAKRLEEVWVPDDDYPVILERSSEGLYLLQRVRDEAHRFAIRAHRRRRSKGMTASALDEIPGVGPARAKALLKVFGSVKQLRAATVEEIATVPGLGERSAQAVHDALHRDAPTSSSPVEQPGPALPPPVEQPGPALPPPVE